MTIREAKRVFDENVYEDYMARIGVKCSKDKKTVKWRINLHSAEELAST